jgi:hypothetical protein
MEGTTEKPKGSGSARYVCLMSIRVFPAQCPIKPEPQVTAFIPPPIVQLRFGCGNPYCAQSLATQGLSGQVYPPEDIEMFTRKGLVFSFGRAAALTTVAALALTAFEPSMAQAGAVAPGKGVSATSGTSDATDISAARRRYYRGGGGGAAAAAAFAGIVGTGLAIAASQDRGYYGGPAYYGGGPYDAYGAYDAPPAYYGGGGYYGGGYGYRSGVPRVNGHPLAGW